MSVHAVAVATGDVVDLADLPAGHPKAWDELTDVEQDASAYELVLDGGRIVLVTYSHPPRLRRRCDGPLTRHSAICTLCGFQTAWFTDVDRATEAGDQHRDDAARPIRKAHLEREWSR